MMLFNHVTLNREPLLGIYLTDLWITTYNNIHRVTKNAMIKTTLAAFKYFPFNGPKAFFNQAPFSQTT